jgi:hypothetical protein
MLSITFAPFAPSTSLFLYAQAEIKQAHPLRLDGSPAGALLTGTTKLTHTSKSFGVPLSSELGVSLPEPDGEGKQPATADLLPPTRADLIAIQERVAKFDDRLASFASTMKLLAWLIVALLIVGRLVRSKNIAITLPLPLECSPP